MAPVPQHNVEGQDHEVVSAESLARRNLRRWKATHEKQITEHKVLPVLKGSLTRVKNFYEESARLTLQAIEEIEDPEELTAARAVFDEWELCELEWQDERDDYIRQLENPAPQINIQLSQAEKRSRFQALHTKAQAHAEGLLNQLQLICDNLASSITSRALVIIKEQISNTKDEVTNGLWGEYEKLIELDPDQRQPLSQEYAASKKKITDAAAVLLTAALGLLPASPVITTPDNSIIGASEASTIQGSVSSRQSFSYQKEKLPIFDGQLRSYPRWARQWKDAQQFYGEDQFFLMLDKSTPKWLDILSNATLEEAWQQMDARFANTRVVAQAALADYSAFVPKTKSKNERLIEVAEHVNRVYADLCAVGKGGEMDKTENLILKVLEWVDKDHRDDLVDLFRKDELAPPDRRVGVFQLTYKFLKDNRLNLMKYTALTDKPPQDAHKPFCLQCKKAHLPPVCKRRYDLRVHNQERQVDDQDGAHGDESQTTDPGCKFCEGSVHTYTSRWNSEVYPSNRCYDCPEFMKLTDVQRADYLESIGGCSVCTSPDHGQGSCTASWQSCGLLLDDGTKCQGRHNRALHNANTAFVINNGIEVNNVSHDVETNDDPPPVLLFIQKLRIRGKVTTSLLYDSGSNTSLITRALAKLLNLPKKLVGCWVTVATREPEYVETYVYELTVPITSGGKEWMKKLVLYEVPGEITSAPQKVDVSAAYTLFPNVPVGALERPTDRVGILLGLDAADIMPVGGDSQLGGRQGNLLCLKTILGGPGYVLGGSHPLITATDADFTPLVNTYKQARVVEPVKSITVNSIGFMQTYGEELLTDDLGIQPPPMCSDCRACVKCQKNDVELSKQDREILNKVRDSLQVVQTETGPVVHISYPLNQNYDLLVNNKMQAISRQTSLERKLLKMDRMDEYNACYQDSIDRGVMVEITDSDIDDWLRDPNHRVHFTGHHAVLKDSSKTTPLRVVNDSKMKNGYTGPSANDVMYKGPDRLASLFLILLRWRQYPICILWDVSKAYNSAVTAPPENFIRCQVWRFGKVQEAWRIFQYRCMAFGDLIASLGLEVIKEKGCEIAEERKEVSPDAIAKVQDDMYVDDGISGCNSDEEADRLIGTMTILPNDKLSYDGEIAKVLGYVGLKPKVFIRSGVQNPQQALDKQGNVLGHIYDPATDAITFRFSFKVKFAKGKAEQDLTLDNLKNLLFSRRNCLAITMQIFDPMGIVSPLSIALKIASKDVTALNKPWDDRLPSELQELWQMLLHRLLSCPDIVIPRKVCPDVPEHRPELIGMYDGSQSAYSGVVYIRYRGASGWQVRVYVAKARVTPSKGMTVPRSELNSFLITTRLVLSICKAMTVKPTRVTFCGDSECTISSYESEQTALAPYFSNRVYECEQNIGKIGKPIPSHITVHHELTEADITEHTQVDLMQHVAGVLNTADIATRGHANYGDVSPDSEWVNGPKFLSEDRSSWPMSRDFIREVPETEKRSRMFKLINVTRFDSPEPGTLLFIIHSVSKYKTLRGIFARLILAHKTRQPPSRSQTLSAEMYAEADRVLLWLTMPMTHKLFIEDKLTSLCPFWEDGILYTQGRLGTAGLTYLGPSKLPIIHANSRLALLILKQAHEEDHKRTPSEALFRSRRLVWIHRGKSTAILVTKNCAWCAVNKVRMQEQRMADLPPQIFDIPTSPWVNITMDFMAPVMVKSMTNKRSLLKCFPLVICCMNVCALTVRLVPGYDTESLMTQLKSHIAIRGQFRFVYTDSGSQLKAAKEMIEDGMQPVDWAEVKQRTASLGVEWRVAPPESQWRDGRSERMVQALKASVKHIHPHGQTLNYAELQCLYDQCADVINDRPLGVHHHNGEDPDYAPVTPNSLLKGSHSQLPTLDMSDASSYSKAYANKLRHIDNIFTSWWKGFESQVFDSLTPYPKWRQHKENLVPDDVCLLRYDAKLGKPQFRLCQVVRSYPDEKGDVRTVDIVMRPRDTRERPLPYVIKENKPSTVSVQRLALLYSSRYENESGEADKWPKLPVPNSKC